MTCETACALEDEAALGELHAKAVGALREASRLPPLELSGEVDVAERAVVALRDCLIARLRGDPLSASAGRWRAALGRANQALSLVVGVEYPAAGLHREMIDGARRVLDAAVDEDFHGFGAGEQAHGS